jgi:hypothetical protein
LGKAEFVPVHCADDERVPVQAFDLDVRAVAPQDDIGGGEGDALIAVEEAVVVAERERLAQGKAPLLQTQH